MKLFSLWALLLIFTHNSYSAIYKWTDAQGNVHFGDKKPDTHEVDKLDLNINTYSGVTHETSPVDHGQKVVMYSTAWCGYCKKARRYFNKNNIAYTEYDIEKDAAARKRYRQLGATGVPVILVGSKRMNGFSVKGFQRIYKYNN